MNWHEATLGECWEELQRHLTRRGDRRIPFEPTLDAIAASLPEMWRWSRIEWVYREGGDSIDAYAFGETQAVLATADTEILARARCACLAWEASGK